jgi:hypothetical protein
MLVNLAHPSQHFGQRKVPSDCEMKASCEINKIGENTSGISSHRCFERCIKAQIVQQSPGCPEKYKNLSQQTSDLVSPGCHRRYVCTQRCPLRLWLSHAVRPSHRKKNPSPSRIPECGYALACYRMCIYKRRCEDRRDT